MGKIEYNNQLQEYKVSIMINAVKKWYGALQGGFDLICEDLRVNHKGNTT